MRNYLWVVCVVLISQQNRGLAKEKECENDAECEVRWPQSFCRKGTCKCKPNYVRQKSESRGWVCLSVLDASRSFSLRLWGKTKVYVLIGCFLANSELGPPLTCPLPDGAGFRVIYKDPNGASVFCQLKEHDGADKLPPCPDGYECIHSIGFLSGDWDGVCCPKQG